MEEKKNIKVLVTGGSGFVGGYCILALLNEGYSVKTTLRSLARVQEVKDSLTAAGAHHVDEIEFAAADLTKDDGWDEAVKGCTYVLHVASPFPMVQPDDENELIIPARDGALRVLKAARNAGVKRVVLTSSFAAIGYGQSSKDHVFTEEDWTNIHADVRAYIKSKTIAEKAAWDFIGKDGSNPELSVINPVGIFGPVMAKDRSTSIQLVEGILAGAIKEDMPYFFGVVDVRDVASLHVKAMTLPEAKGERFLATSDGTISLKYVADLIRKERPELAENVVDFPAASKELYVHMSNQKARTILQWTPYTKEEALLATLDSLSQH
ncbi:aldehyde reductase [Terrimonas sp. NA20]|uniref:Aldehyde reductase n=1 Tax=Terrimonas ginsenosidimutans TaxID=2908004 RepID=A0ABS9KUB2_9BACT|nr:aldehyde reductase [Terrimonas ginsenosidimutans]MCG2615929.1 aldehyde reductase [Terrimonas ginsenosidimutans]